MSNRVDTPRYACVGDLNNYFKKSDLLSGLTSLEQQKLRSNIGIIDGSSQGDVKELTYAELISNISNNLLVIGTVYRIIDFQSIWEIDNKSYTGQQYGLLVIATTLNSLFPQAFIEGKKWLIQYDVTQKTLSDGTTTKGQITYLEDENGNSAYYDFKNIKFKRNNTFYYTFSDTINGTIIDSSTLSNTKYNRLEKDSYNNIFIGDTYNNIIQPGCTGNTFYSGCINSVIGYNSVNNIFREAVRYLSGTVSNKVFAENDTTLSTTITKTIQKVNEHDLVSFLDPITYAYQVIII